LIEPFQPIDSIELPVLASAENREKPFSGVLSASELFTSATRDKARVPGADGLPTISGD